MTVDMVQDRKTGEWYNPEAKFKELMQEDWFITQMRRMKDESWEEGVTDAFCEMKRQ